MQCLTLLAPDQCNDFKKCPKILSYNSFNCANYICIEETPVSSVTVETPSTSTAPALKKVCIFKKSKVVSLYYDFHLSVRMMIFILKL